MAPLAALTGRLNALLDVPWALLSVADGRGETAAFSLGIRLGSIGHAQAVILKFGAYRPIRLCLNRNLQTTVEAYLTPGDIVDEWAPHCKRWHGVYRVCYDTGRNIVLGGHGVVFKQSTGWTRLRERSGKMVTSSKTSAIPNQIDE